MSFPPWHDLKQLEMACLADRLGGTLSSARIDDLKRLLAAVSEDPDAGEAICFHGATALVLESEGDTLGAIRHRELEVQKIERLHETVKDNPKSASALANYDVPDLEIRQGLLSTLRGLAT